MVADRAGIPWTHEETLTAFVLYMHIPRERFYACNKNIIALSQAVVRKPLAHRIALHEGGAGHINTRQIGVTLQPWGSTLRSVTSRWHVR